MQLLTLIKPDDWHTHLRDGNYLQRTVADTALFFNRSVVMPNLQSPIMTVAMAAQYRSDILQHIPAENNFQPLMTLYLNNALSADDIRIAKESGIVIGAKLYPKGATTHSEKGIADIQDLYPVFDAMQKYNLPLLIHGEIANDADIFDRETLFIENVLKPLINTFPQLKIVLEHISTREAVQFIEAAPAHVAATITAHHLLLNRNDLLAGGIKPHHYCLPILKREADRQALLTAATSGNPKFFLGTDSAPHARDTKERACGCAGIYTAFHAIPLYLSAFESVNALHCFETFASFHGADFYELPRNTNTITFIKKEWQIPESLSFGNNEVIPLFAGKTLPWQLHNERRFT